jgi:TetR/AcrR family transcriptional regulator, mexJK operon transcriptional repressor
MAAREEEYELKRRQIIDGALNVFSDKGFEKATNQEIASAAGIGSPGLIYHYFESKSDLLHQAVASRSPLLQSVIGDDALFGLPPREALHLVGSAILHMLDDPGILQLFRVMVGEAMRDPSVAEAWRISGPRPALGALARYLKSQMEAGRMRTMDPSLAASCFLGQIIFYVISQAVFHQQESAAGGEKAVLEAAIEIFLTGMEAR